MSDYTQPPGPAGTNNIPLVHWRKVALIGKDEETKLLACRAALRECVEALEVAQVYVESGGWTRHRDDEIAQIEEAITKARKALE